MVEQDLNKSTVCILPFIHLATHPNGVVTPCCQSDMTNGLSFSKTKEINILEKNSLEEITNSTNFCEIRKLMLNNERPEECLGCYKLEDENKISKRIYENNTYGVDKYKVLDLVDDNGKLKKLNYRYIELRLGNVCNLKCLTCNPMSSNKWLEDIDELPIKFQSGYYSLDSNLSGWYKNKNWYDELLDNSDDIEAIFINGGEPMLIKEHIYFLEKLYNQGKSNKIKLSYNINLTTISNKVIDLWNKFKLVELNVSIDDLGLRNNYIRYPSDFNKIEANLEKLMGKNLNIKITQTLSVLNVYNVVNFYDYFTNKGLVIEHNFVHWPEYLHVSLLDKKLKSKIDLNKLPTDKAERLKLELNADYSTHYGDFKEYIKRIDKIRGLNIKDYLKEIQIK